VAVLALWGLRRATWLPAAVLACGMVVGSFASITIMGWWFPGRMLIAGVPGLVVLVALGAARLPRTAWVLAAWSLAVGAAVAWSAHHGGIRLAVDPWTVGAPLAWAWPFPDFRSFGPAQVAVSLAWGAVALALVRATRPVADPGAARAVEAPSGDDPVPLGAAVPTPR
jgi:hypothetical protein